MEYVPHETFIVRYPAGDADFHSGFRAPSLGDTITKRVKFWRVVRVGEDWEGCVGVTVMPAEAAPHGTRFRSLRRQA